VLAWPPPRWARYLRTFCSSFAAGAVGSGHSISPKIPPEAVRIVSPGVHNRKLLQTLRREESLRVTIRLYQQAIESALAGSFDRCIKQTAADTGSMQRGWDIYTVQQQAP